MAIDKKILQEISRYRSINNYISEQELGDIPGVPPVGEEPAAGEVAPPTPEPPATGATETVDVTTDTEVEEVNPEGEPIEAAGEGEDTEEIDITELIDSQKNMTDKQEEYFNNLFSQLETLQSKLGEMDQLVQKLNAIEAKVDRYKPKTPEEKLELRSLDSGPFKQKLSDFFEDKLPEMEKSGKNEYVLTGDEVQNYSPSEVEKSFDAGIEPFNPDIYYK